MWDSMLGKGFKAQKCKTLLRLAMARIKLLRNKREIQVKQMRREISQLLTSGQEPSARIRVEHIIREQNILAAYDILELFCELVAVRLPIIEAQKTCPLDLKEAISSLIFASPRCSDLPELLQIRQLFAAKYGKEFAAAAAELRPDCGVNRRIIEKLSVRAPSGEVKLKLMKEIAAEHNVDWDPTDTEEELLKSHEDLLDGPNHFVAANEVPSSPLGGSRSTAASDVSTDVPTIAMSQMPADLGGLLSSSSLYEDEGKNHVPFKNIPPPTKYEPPSPIDPPARKVEVADRKADQASHTVRRDTASDVRPDNKEDTYGSTRKEGRGDYVDVASAAKAAAESANRAVAAARAAAELARTQSGYDSNVSDKIVRRDSRAAAEDEESATDLDSDEEDDSNMPVQVNISRGRHGQETNRAPARYSDSESDSAEYDVPRGRGAGGTKQRPNVAYERPEVPELFREPKLPLKATRLDFQAAEASGKPVFDDDDGSGGENSGSSKYGKQERENRSHGDSNTSKYKGGGLKWVSREESREESDYDIFDANRDKTTLRYSAFDTSDHNYSKNDADHDLSKPEETYSSYDRPFAGKSNSSKFDRDSSPLFDEEGSVGRVREPSRFGSLPRTSHYDDEEGDTSPFSGVQKYGAGDYPSSTKPGVFNGDPSPKTVDEDDLDARFEALKLARRW